MKKVLLLLIGWLSAIGTIHADLTNKEVEGMTALVGPGCVIDQIDKSLIEAVASTADLGNIVDNNLNNYASFSSALSAGVAYTPTLAIKDIKYKYPGGTTAGFVIQAADEEGTNLLSANILKMFVVETYYEGTLQETSTDSESPGSSILDLNLLTIASNGKTKIAVNTTKEFNEIRLSVAGINANVLSHLKIYYAFVGENPIIPITKTEGNNFPDASVHASNVTGIGNEWTTAVWNWPAQKENLVGAGSENKGVGFGTLSSLLTEPRVTIDAGKIIPAGTEVGFMIESGSVLAIEILNNTILKTFDANDNEVDSKKIISVLGISAIGGGKSLVSMVTTQPCRQIKIQFGGLNIDVGGTKIFYAYTRSTEVKVPNDCELKLSADIVVCSGSQTQINGPEGTLWSIISQPEGASATITSSGLINNMSKDGDYIVKGALGNCEKTVTVTKGSTSPISYNCNRPIVGENIATYAPTGGGCLLCLATGITGSVDNITDSNLTNYVEYTQGLDLASNTSIIGVQNLTQPYTASESAPRRVGFVMQATNQFLDVDLLKFFVIKTYLGDKEQESSLVEQNNAIGADLIAGLDNQIRYSFVATKNFDKVALWTAGLLNINISKFRIYYAFEEPADNNCLVGNGSAACVSLLSSDEYGAQIAYNHTGFSGLANVGAFMTNLSKTIDGDMNSYALINKVAGIGSTATLSVKIDRIIENGYQAGFIIQDQTWVTNADLLSQVKIKTYLNGVQTGDEFGTPAVLSLDLIGSGDRAYLTVIPTQPFDEIQLDLSGLLDAAVNTKVFGAFIRKDTDSDGTPDCIDKNPCGEEVILKNLDISCAEYPATISFTGGKDNAIYSLWDGTTEHIFDNSKTVSFIPMASGNFIFTIRENGNDIMDIPVTIHPRRTKWTGAVSNDWNNPENWTEGVPGPCTDVVIPEVDSLTNTDTVYYPILNQAEQCAGIHFEPGAEVIRMDLLDYVQAWVEVTLQSGINQMVSIPLKETYVGDIFIGKDSPNYEDRDLFSHLIGDVRRFSPSISVKQWTGRGWGNNILDYNIPLPSATSVFVDRGTYPINTEFTFRFAKEDSLFYYYDAEGIPTSQVPDTIRRNKNLIGKMIYEDSTNNAIYKVKLEGTSTIVPIGNPYMCHLKVHELYAENPGIISQIKVFPTNPADGNLLPNNATLIDINDTTTTIAPMQAFFITLSSAKSREITFNAETMMVHGDYSTVAAPQTRATKQHNTESKIQLSSLKAYTQNGEGVIESSEKIETLQVFNVSGQLLINKQNVSSPVRITLSEGVNFIKVQTEKETKTFKLIK